MACYAAAGRARAAHVRGAARAGRRRGARGGGGAPASRPRRRRCGPRSGGRRDRRPGRPHGAVEEHRAGDARLRGAAGARTPSGAAEVVHVALAYPSRQGLAEYLAYAADVEHTAERINHAFGRVRADGWTPIVLSVQDDRARSLAALTLSDVLLVNPVRDGLNLVAKEGPLLNTARRRAGAVPPGRGVGGARAGRRAARSGSIPSTWPARPTPCTPRSDHAVGRAGGTGRRPLRGAVRATDRRPTGGPTSWRPLSAERDGARSPRPRRPAARSSATAPAAPAHREIGRRRPPRRGLSVSTAATRTAYSGGAVRRRAASCERGEGGQVADVVAERGGGAAGGSAARRARPRASAPRSPCPPRAAGAARARAGPGGPSRPRAACWRARRRPPPSPCAPGAWRQCSVTVRPLGST